MLGLFYLLLCFLAGWAICTCAFPDLSRVTETAYDKRKISISPYLLLLPAWFITGVLALTWAVYITASLFANHRHPLIYADAIVLPIALAAVIIVIYLKKIRQKNNRITFFCNDRRTRIIEILLLAGISVLACILMLSTFYVRGGQLHIGATVFSDFSPHIGMIRSFSYGNNFPTSYSHYGGEDIKYHFMFQFFAANLEFLGLRLDYAFNLPSIISFISAFLLLYLLTVKITASTGAGILACLFFAYRSSKTLFTYLSKLPVKTDIIRSLSDNTDFISDTPHEDWGLWNLNVYCNQRHLAFGLSVMFFILLLFLPRLYEMFEAIKRLGFQMKADRKKNNRTGKNFCKEFARYIKMVFFSKEGWLAKDLRQPIFLGVVLGSLAFFHGAVVIACLMILFVMAAFSNRRLEYLITAVIAYGLSTIQTHYFIRGSVITTKFLFGFIAENKTIFGAAAYLGKLLGILPVVLLAAFCLEKGVGRYIMFAFTVPLIFAFTVSLTIDVTVNHKYIMMSCILLGIFSAGFLMKLFERRNIFIRMTGILLIILLTATGIYDFTTILKKNSQSEVILNLKDPLTDFVKKHSDSKDLYLTASYTVNQVVLGGAMLYEGHQYYAWSAGYDTDYRDSMVKKMYEAQTPSELDTLVKENNIRYIIVDHENRVSTAYKVNEDNISSSYQSVYEDGEGENKITIYDTKLPLFHS